MKKGKVFFVGAGPGDPKLITLRGLECLQQSDVIVYDRLVNPELLTYAREDARKIFCGKFPDRHVMRQEQINDVLVREAGEGQVVTRLKGGDPCVFGRVGEEAVHCASHDIEFEIVPGITAGIAAPAYAGIPVTHRDYGSSFAFVTGHLRDRQEDHRKWEAFARGIDTIAFYMGINKLSHICERLIEHGRDPETPVAIIEWGTTENQRTIVGELHNIVEKAEQHNMTHPAIILVGDIVTIREKMQWFQERGFSRLTGV
ncbi:MAG: uroporphyrinogen-III C-methyltransferase [Bacillaceae bacterium]|nr:uroporphyrinogen-III C-methyltransferase [Bacillaceae bacterium]